MTKPYWQGVFPAITTQFAQDQSLDLRATVRHIEVLIESGVSGLIACGSLGENQTLSAAEKRQVVEAAVKAARGRIPVLSGVAEMSTAAACEYARDCQRLGATGLMVMPAMVYRADDREALAYFRRIDSATSLPWMLYNNPIGYPVDITPALLAELADVKNLVAVKESSGNTRRITEIRLELGDRFALFIGVDDLVLEAAVVGIDGWVAGAGIAFPLENQRFWRLTREGRWDEARAFYRWYSPLLKLDTHLKFVQYLKLAVQEAGLGREWVREPRLPLVGEERDRVLAIIRRGIETRPALP
jgi:4-hydroxy-tetrahydrodipicolinate synthase